MSKTRGAPGKYGKPDTRGAPGMSDRPRPAVVIHPDAECLALAVATLFVEEARRAVQARGRFSVALAGGSTPRRAYELLAIPPFAHHVPWTHVHIFWGDERCVDPQDPRSNERMARESLLDHVPIPEEHVHPIRCPISPISRAGRRSGARSGTSGSSFEREALQAADDYERLLGSFFPPERSAPSLSAEAEQGTSATALDFVLLGLGEDGHTASLFPGSDALRVTERKAVATFVTKRAGASSTAGGDDLWRVTLTAPFINRAARVVFVVSGPGKASIVAEVLGGPFDPDRLPAQLIRPHTGSLVWHLDQDSAVLLPTTSLGRAAGATGP